jgi:hypothetical membrane protein
MSRTILICTLGVLTASSAFGQSSCPAPSEGDLQFRNVVSADGAPALDVNDAGYQSGQMKPTTNTNSRVMTAGAALLCASLVAAHVLAPDSYSWRTNTISELASQHYEHAWITRAGFITFGGMIGATAARQLAAGKRHWTESLPLVLYGTSIAATGVFSAAPFESGVAFSQTESHIHSVFANTAGASLSAAILAKAWTARSRRERLGHAAALAFVTLSSAMFQIQPEYRGAWQRALWIGGLGWLTLSY